MSENLNPITIPKASTPSENQEQQEAFLSPFNNPDFTSFLIEYLPGIEEEVIGNPNVGLFILDEKYAILSVRISNFKEIIRSIKNIAVVSADGLYTPNAISPTDSTKAYIFHTNPYLTLNGTGVLVGIIDSGIDYLNKEFLKEDDTTRIFTIWDQTERPTSTESTLVYGREYNSSDINKAIKLFQEGGDPYSIVPHKDISGHGTMVAGVIGGRGKDRDLEGIAPDCTFAIVKLRPTTKAYADLFRVKNTDYTYKNSAMILAMRYLNQLSIVNKMPLVLCIPLGNNLGSHDGRSVIDSYINKISDRRALTFVTSTGNEGNTDTHTQGILTKSSPVQTIELQIAEGQMGIAMGLYISNPNTINLTIISPSGESITGINARIASSDLPLFEGTKVPFVYEGTDFYVAFYSPDLITGDERIEIRADGLKPGIWKFRLQGALSIDTRYDAWIPQRELLIGDTKFLNSVPYTTLELPSTGDAIITTSYYNQNNDSIVVESGRGFTRDNRVRPIVTAPGVNVTVTTPGNGKKVVSGGSIAAAVVSGVCALLLEWGIVKGNDKSLRAVNIQSYLTRGATRNSRALYPNPEWGYGIVNVEGIFDVIRNIKNSSGSRSIDIGEYTYNNKFIKEYYINDLFIRNPYL